MASDNYECYFTPEEVFQDWFQESAKTVRQYKEPVLDDNTIILLKLACDMLNQDSHVFIMSTEVLEQYICAKNRRNVKIEDGPLTLGGVIFICSKHVGEQSDLKVHHIKSVLGKLTGSNVDAKKIRRAEIDIFLTLDGNLPLTSAIDELNIFLEIYVKPLNLRVDIQQLCVEILEVVIMSMKILFHDIKSVYSLSEEAFCVFKCLISNKCYVPAGTILCAFRLTQYQNYLNIHQISVDFGDKIAVHSDHLKLLSDKIYDLFKYKL